MCSSVAVWPRMDPGRIHRVDGQAVGDPRAVRGPEGRTQVAPGPHTNDDRPLTGVGVKDQDLRLPRDAGRLLLERQREDPRAVRGEVACPDRFTGTLEVGRVVHVVTQEY